MSLTKTSLPSLVKKQFLYKLKSYIGVFSSIIVLQLLALFFSLNGVGSRGTGIDVVFLSIDYYSADMVIAFTMIGIFINAIIITTKANREDDFAFVTNRLSGNLSNIAFLVVVSVFGGITAILSGYLLKVVLYFMFDTSYVTGTGWMASPLELFYGVTASILFIFLTGALGYIVGMIVQLNKIFIVLLPALVISSLIVATKNGENILVKKIGTFFFQESSLIILMCKVIVTAALLFAGALVISNRKEVRQ